MSDVAVIGGGPKACALAAKTAVLGLRGDTHATLTVFEPNDVGASWGGQAGFTDGLQDLCTPALRDVGFPYDDPLLDEIGQDLLGRFSWVSCLISKEMSYTYAEWVSKGCPAPSHEDFSRYLAWVMTRAAAAGPFVTVVKSAVVSIDHDAASGKWLLTCEGAAAQGFDGVVLTGVKERPSVLVEGDTGDWFRSGASFWNADNLSGLRAFAKAQEAAGEGNISAVVIGNGGTAASIALCLGEGIANIDVTMVGSRLFLDSRPANFFADRFFCDMERWDALSLTQRQAFSGQLNSGAIWQPVVERLKKISKLEYQIGYAKRVIYRPDFRGDPMYHVAVSEDPAYDGDLDTLPTVDGQIVIDATGFDPVWFKSLLSEDLGEILDWDDRDAVQTVRDKCNHDLSVSFTSEHGREFPPNFYVPMLGDFAHPGAPNLMALGSVADRILERYRRT